MSVTVDIWDQRARLGPSEFARLFTANAPAVGATSIAALKGITNGDVYVVASGASVDKLLEQRPDFFYGRFVVAINEMWEHIPATYAIMHHHEHAQAAIDAGQDVVVSDLDLGGPGWGTPHACRGNYWFYRSTLHDRSANPTIDVEALRQETTDGLVTSCCTTSEALQFAAHLGASTIVCCGIDGGALDGQTCVKGYNGGYQTNPQHLILTQTIIQHTLGAIRAKGIAVFGLSPFVGCNNEGHRYEHAPVLEGRALLQALKAPNRQEP